jgi:hypothetical protein
MTKRAFQIGFAATLVVLFCSEPNTSAQSGSSAPSLRRIVVERYPLLAHLANTDGDVQLVAQVSPQGSVQGVRVTSGAGLLAGPAKAMLLRWAFDPCGTQNCEARVTFHFVLDPGMCASTDCPSEIQVDLPATITIRSKHRPAIVN